MEAKGTKLIKSKKFKGVYHSILSNGGKHNDKSFYVIYKLNGKTHKVFMGKESEGINEPFCAQQRNDIINKARFGEDAPIVKYKNKSGVLFSDMVEKYVQSKTNSRKVTLAYIAIKDIFGNSRLDEITIDAVNKFKNKLISDNKSPKTVTTYLQRINTIFNFAIDRELFKGQNPCKKVDKPKIDNERVRYLAHDEVTQLKEAIKDKPMLLLFVELSLSTGGRLETITSISKKDINLISCAIQLKNHKTNNTYAGFISDSLLLLLKARYSELQTPNDKVITTSPKTIQKQLQPLLNKLFNQGLDTKDTKNRVVVHTLRHTFASHLAINGVSIFTIMKLLDYKDIKDTLRYAKLSPDNGLEAVRGLWK
ncbi:MAG: tyrosine-type recombinase/integrase [Campylobacteraceae bacterium]|jgi:site-specific recombinase XerD|nr:tyrosine-type recombinase/integrase [Campylobacteraceae bacterium]